jgi:2-methylcitrate dehydratase PrpD
VSTGPTIVAGSEPTLRIAQWVASLPRERTRAVQALAIDGVRDLIGCMIAGSVEPPARAAARVAATWGGGVSSLVGSSQTVSAQASAFANGAAAHVLDFDDSFAPLTGHPSAPILPAVLALGEEVAASGAALLDAYVVGLEVIATVGRVMNPSHYARGWHSTATIGVIGAAAACARLLGLNANQTAAAMSIAMSSSGGSRVQLGSPMKSIHAGLAARDAVVSASLAAEGVTGASEVLVGLRGFQNLYSGADAGPEAFVVPGADEPLAISSPGLTFKPYPICGSTHRSIDALLDLREMHQFSADDVASVTLNIPAVNANNLIYPNPTSGMEAKFSMHYCAALAIAQGAIRLGDFTEEAIHRPAIRALMTRIVMQVTPGSEQTTKDYLELPAHTVVRLQSGVMLNDERYGRRGSRELPMSASEHAAKFEDCAGRLLEPDETERLLDLISKLGAAKDIHDLAGLLRRQSPAPTQAEAGRHAAV